MRALFAGSLLALAALPALSSIARAEPVSTSVRTVLEERRYRFCHEEDYPLTPDEHAWCDLVGTESEVCPALVKACEKPAVAGARRGSRRSARDLGQTKGKAVDRPTQEDTRTRPEPELELSLPNMSGFARVLFFGMLAVGLAILVRFIVGNMLRGRDEAPKTDEPPPVPGPEGAPVVARGPVETDVQRLLARARAAAAQGDFARAVDDAYAALLRRLDGDGLIEIHPSRTNGDYVRALRDRPEVHRAVRSIARDVEAVQFGATPPSDPVFRSVLERVLPLVSRALGVVLVGFGLSVALSCAPHEKEDEGRGDTSPSGTQAVIEVLGKHGVKVRRRSESLLEVKRPLSLVLLADVSLDAAAWKHLLAWVRDDGGHLILAGVPNLPAELDQRIVADTELSTLVTAAPGVHWVGHPALSVPPGRHLESVETPRVRPEGTALLRGDLAVLTERTVGEGRVMVLAEDRLVSNAALTVDEDASLLVSLLFRSSIGPDREVEICDEWTGLGAETPLDSVRRAELTPVVVQLFILAALLFLWKGLAFARLRDPPAAGRRAFADHARALGLAYGRARATRHVAGLYAAWAMERLRERVHRGGRPGLIPLAEAIAARTGRTEGEVMRVLVEASSARDDTAPPSSFRPNLRGAKPAKPGKDAAAADLALMNELMSFLAATGQRRPTDRTDPRAR